VTVAISDVCSGHQRSVERALAQGPPGARVEDRAVELAHPTGRVTGFRITT
jgi:hypothetical protein